LYIISFDIEEWFHIFHPTYENQPGLWDSLSSRVEKNTNWVLDFLNRHQLKATFFCMGWVAEKYPQLIKSIDQEGHEIAAHSYLHNKVKNLTPELFREDTKRVIEILESLTGNKLFTYRAPGFSMDKSTLWAFEILHEFGIENDSSFKSGLHMGFPGRIPKKPFLLKGNGYTIKEFPTRTFNFFGDHIIYSGSGYFRVFPYGFVKRLFQSSVYEMAYFHPRDFDNDIHHYFKNNPVLQLRYRIGTNQSKQKLAQLVNTFKFVTINQALNQVNWEQAPVLDLTNGKHH